MKQTVQQVVGTAPDGTPIIATTTATATAAASSEALPGSIAGAATVPVLVASTDYTAKQTTTTAVAQQPQLQHQQPLQHTQQQAQYPHLVPPAVPMQPEMHGQHYMGAYIAPSAPPQDHQMPAPGGYAPPAYVPSAEGVITHLQQPAMGVPVQQGQPVAYPPHPATQNKYYPPVPQK